MDEEMDRIEMMNMGDIPEEVKQGIKGQLLKAVAEAADVGGTRAVLGLIRDETPDDLKAELLMLLEQVVEKAAEKGDVSDLLAVLDDQDVSEDAREKAAKKLPKAVETAAEIEDLSELALVIGRDGVPDDVQIRAIEAISEVTGASGAINAIGIEDIPEAVQARAVEIAAEKIELPKALESVFTQDVPSGVRLKATELALEAEEDEALLEAASYAATKGKLGHIVDILDMTDSKEVKEKLVGLLPEALWNAQENGSTDELLSIIGKRLVPEDLQVGALKTLAAQGNKTIVDFIGKEGVPGAAQTVLVKITLDEEKNPKVLSAIGNPGVPAETQIEILKIAAKNGWASDVVKAAESDVLQVKESALKLLSKAVKVARKDGKVSELLEVVGKESLPKKLSKKMDEIFYDAIQAARDEEWFPDIVKIVGSGLPVQVQKRAAEVALHEGLEQMVLQRIENAPETVREYVLSLIPEESEEVEEEKPGKVEMAEGLDPGIINAVREGSISGLFRIYDGEGASKEQKEDVMGVLPFAVENALKEEKYSQVIDLIKREKVPDKIKFKAIDTAAKLGRIADLLDAVDNEELSGAVREKAGRSFKKAIKVAESNDRIHEIRMVIGRGGVPEDIQKAAARLVQPQEPLLADLLIKAEAAKESFKKKARKVYVALGAALKTGIMWVAGAASLIRKPFKQDQLKKSVNEAKKQGDVSGIVDFMEDEENPLAARYAAKRLLRTIKNAAKGGRVSQLLDVQERDVSPKARKKAVDMLPKALEAAAWNGWSPGILQIIGEEGVPETLQQRAVEIAAEKGRIDVVLGVIGDEDLSEGLQTKAVEVLVQKGLVSDIIGVAEDYHLHEPLKSKAREAIPDAVENAAMLGKIDELIGALLEKAVPESVQEQAVEMIAAKGKMSKMIELIKEHYLSEAVQVRIAKVALREGWDSRLSAAIERSGADEQTKKRVREVLQNPHKGDGVLSSGSLKMPKAGKKPPRMEKAGVKA